MTQPNGSTFARRVRAARPRNKTYDVWDDVIAGLGLRVGATGYRSFFLRRSVHGRKRYAAIGSADEMTVPEARQKARERIAAFIDTAKTNGGPRTPGRPMDAFAGEFLERYSRHWKPATLKSSAVCIHNHILPAFGHLTVDAVTMEHVKDWFASMAVRPGMANRSMPVLSTMMRMAEPLGLPAPQLQSLQEHQALPDDTEGTVPVRGGDGPAQHRAHPRRVLVPERRRHRPPADADRMPRRRDRLARMGLDQGQAHTPSRFQVRAAHGLAVQSRPCGH